MLDKYILIIVTNGVKKQSTDVSLSPKAMAPGMGEFF